MYNEAEVSLNLKKRWMEMKQSIISILLLVIITGVIVYFIMKSRKYKTEKEKNAIDKGLVAYLFTNSFLVSWLVYRKNKNNDHL